MYCAACGAQNYADDQYCSACGKPLLPQAFAYARVDAKSGIGEHVQLLGIFWLVLASLHLLVALAILVFARISFVAVFPAGTPSALCHLVPALFVLFALLLSTKAILGLAAGFGLLKRAGWARRLALVVAFLSLIEFPLGMGLAIYTFWVLLSPNAEGEYRALRATESPQMPQS